MIKEYGKMEQKNLLEEKPEKKPMNRKKTILSVLIILLITAIVFIIFFNFNDINTTIDLIKTVDGNHMGMAVLCLVLYAALWPLSLLRNRKSLKHIFWTII